MKPFFRALALICAAFCVLCAAACSAPGSPASSRQDAAETLSDPCSGSIARLDSLTLSGTVVGNPRVSCAEWREPFSGITSYARWITSNGAKLPIVIYRRNGNKDGGKPSIFLRIVGGPGGSIAPSQYDKPYVDILEPGDVLISLGYTGTQYGSMYPNSDFDAACRELAAYSKALRMRNPGSRIVVIGEGLGGMLGAAALGEQYGAIADDVVLVSPLLFSPAEANQNFSDVLAHRYANDRKIGVRLIDRPGMPWREGRWSSVQTIDLFARFFPKTAMNMDLSDWIQRLAPRPILIIYGSRDDVIGTAKIPALRRFPQVQVVEIEQLGHRFASADFDRVSAELARYLNSRR